MDNAGEPAMKLDDMILVSIDDHVDRARDMFERHVPAKYADQAPKSSSTTRASSSGVPGRTTSASIGLNAVVGWPKEDWGFDPTSFAEMRPGATTSTSASAT